MWAVGEMCWLRESESIANSRSERMDDSTVLRGLTAIDALIRGTDFEAWRNKVVFPGLLMILYIFCNLVKMLWLLLICPSWRQFVDEHVDKFSYEDENKLEYTEIHNK
jgi:hypothetical protein